jgi:hypothetical protein
MSDEAATGAIEALLQQVTSLELEIQDFNPGICFSQAQSSVELAEIHSDGVQEPKSEGELETQLGKGQATKETFSEARHGSASGGAPFNFCSSPGIYFSLASLCEAKDLAIGTKAVCLVANHADSFALQELNRHHSTRYHRILQRIAQQESHLGGDLETT